MDMKYNLLMSAMFVLSGGIALAQPANDICEDAIDIIVGTDEQSALPVSADTRGATDNTGPFVCSGTWFADDLWFKVSVPNGMAADGIRVRAYFGDEDDDVPSLGMAIYETCDAQGLPLECFSVDDPAFNTISWRCVDDDSTFFVRVWSGRSAMEHSGTFRISAWVETYDTPENILWEETFAGGLGEWTTFGTCDNPDSNANAVWRYLPDGHVGRGFFAVPGTRIKSRTACDGSVGVDSDYDDNLGNGVDEMTQEPLTPGPCTQPAQYVLVSPAIYTGDWNAAGINLKWTQVIRNFNSTYFVSYRTTETGGAWTDWNDMQINQEHEPNGASFVDDDKRFYLENATGGDSIQLRFVYNSNYFYWGIDDVQLVARETHNMRSQSNFFAIAPALFTPVDQVYPWTPLNDIFNAGESDQTNVTLNFTAYNADMEEIYNQNVDYGTITSDSLAENVNFPIPVTLPFDFPQRYTGTYTVTSDSATAENDFDFSDNTNSFEWWTHDDCFSMEFGATREVAVNNLLYDDGAPFSYTFGNYFYLPNGSSYVAEDISWGVFDPEAVAGIPINVVLWEWSDANSDQICQATERFPVGFATTTLTGAEGDNAIIKTPLENFNNPLEDIVLQDNTAYLAMIEYNAMDQTFFFMLASENYDYGAVILSSQQAGDPHYGPVLGFSPDGNIQGIDYEVTEFGNDDRIFFGHDLVPVVRLNCPDPIIIATSDPLSEDNLIAISPNPASHEINVSLDFTNYQDGVRMKVMDIYGKLLEIRNVGSVQVHVERFEVGSYPGGAYLLTVETPAGSRTERFVVLH